MVPIIMLGIALAVLALMAVALWETYKTLRHFGVSVWHFFVDSIITR
jgi:hypothetical protein